MFPEAYALKQRNPNGGPLSNQFREILVSAGLAQPRTHKSQGKGRDAKRAVSELSFHSLRHTATSLLKNAGVSDVVARDIIGHKSVAVSQNYTVIDKKTKREALATHEVARQPAGPGPRRAGVADDPFTVARNRPEGVGLQYLRRTQV